VSRSRQLIGVVCLFTALRAGAPAAQEPTAPPRDLDALMARALQHREVDRRTLSDYVLDEVESIEVLGPGRVPLTRIHREYTWYVRDGIHVRSPVRFDNVPISETDRRKYEEDWYQRELDRRQHRAEREAKRESEGKPPTLGPAALNEPRFVSESYFLDFKFEAGNYYLAGHEALDKHDVLKVDYYPTHLFDDDEQPRTAKGSKEYHRQREKHDDQFEQDIDHKMNKTAQVTLWVDPSENRIVKYTFDNVWMDFLPAAWLVRVDDLHASMEMGQPFEGVWLPKNVTVKGGVTLASGSFEVTYGREFSKYRKADVTSRITVPKNPVK
jgi:hypothetical protein